MYILGWLKADCNVNCIRLFNKRRNLYAFSKVALNLKFFQNNGYQFENKLFFDISNF